MLNQRQIEKLAARYQEKHPFWNPVGCTQRARQLAAGLDPTLERALVAWLATGEEQPFTYGSFSLNAIISLHPTDYLGAVELMKDYMKDPQLGESRIIPL